ncbi:MAG: hypothetical protein JWM19_568 [Actinomycetia bacterium]|nr:hypothetical protein [Actinomycetes bacterium]
MGQGLVKVTIAVVAAVAVFITAWVLWPRPATVAAPQAGQYLDVSACLLTGSSGVAPGTSGAQAWNAMQSASLVSHVMVSYLSDTGPADAPALLSTLVERQCGVIVVTGASQAQVTGAARANPGRRFIFLTRSTAAGPAAVPPNAVVVSSTDASGSIDQAVTALAGTA